MIICALSAPNPCVSGNNRGRKRLFGCSEEIKANANPGALCSGAAAWLWESSSHCHRAQLDFQSVKITEGLQNVISKLKHLINDGEFALTVTFGNNIILALNKAHSSKCCMQ